MDTQILKWWAKFHKLSYVEKRKIFSQLISDECSINCEWRIYRILTRLTFKRYNDIHKIPHPEDRLVQKFIDELDLSPSTAHKWYYGTRKEKDYEQKCDNCKNCRFASTCDGNMDEDSYNSINNKYEYGLISRRLYQIITKTEKFKGLLKEEIEDSELRLILRRLMQYQYYSKKEIVHTPQELSVLEVLKTMSVKPVTVLKWLYVVKDSPELMSLAKENKISPNEVINRCMNTLRNDLKYNLGGEAI